MEGGKHKEFRCPLCQRLSNCLVPFIDVAVDWIDSPVKYNTTQESDEAMADDKTYSTSLHDFLSSTKWWSSRNDNSMKWDGHCTFTAAKEDDKQRTSLSLLPQGLSTKKTKNIFGKRELMSAWNGLLKTPRFVHRRARGLTPDRSSSSDTSAFHSAETEKQTRVADVWRRFMDTVSDYALKADTKRLGEETLALDYGEFRHYLREKALYNKTDALHTELIDVSIPCSLFQYSLVSQSSALMLQWNSTPVACMSVFSSNFGVATPRAIKRKANCKPLVFDSMYVHFIT